MAADHANTTDEQVQCSRLMRERILRDPHRPRYHFCAPEGTAMPFDPNGCIYWHGAYHLFYIFQDAGLPRGGHCWGHASSTDLLHWTHHPTALAPTPDAPEVGIFSGNVFVNKDGAATIAYFGIDAGICIATSQDDDLRTWTKSTANPVIPIPRKGEPGHGQYNVHDPHVWLERDTYYAILNGKVLPKREYDTTFLFKSTDLTQWQYVHPFYQPNPAWTGPEEDCACPDFFALGDRHMLLAISHARGTRYYLGRYEHETFVPEEHHRMNFPGGTCFAPESLVDGRGRRIMWAWVLDRRADAARRASGWSGTMTLPRVLSLGDDGALRIEPAPELQRLRMNHRRHEGLTVPDSTQQLLPDVQGDTLELAVEFLPGDARQFGLAVRCSPDRQEQTLIAYDRDRRCLRIDVARASLDPEIAYQTYCMYPGENPVVTAQEAPLDLAPAAALHLRVFIDRSILEVFANGRQCVTQRIYPTLPSSKGVALFSHAAATQVKSLDSWDMAPTNPY